MTFDFDADRYRETSQHQQEWGERLLGELDLKGNERIVDLGCGDGRLTTQLADLVPDGYVLGVDASERMISLARQYERANLYFERLDFNEIGWSERFDVVFSNAALHWVRDHHRLLGRVFQALRTGGTARFSFAGEGNCATLSGVLREVMAQPRYARYFVNFDWPWYMPAVAEYRAIVHLLPFREARVWGDSADWFFPTVEDMVGWIEQPSIVPFVCRVDEADRSGFRDEVVQRMVQRTCEPDGRCFEMFRRINLLARK